MDCNTYPLQITIVTIEILWNKGYMRFLLFGDFALRGKTFLGAVNLMLRYPVMTKNSYKAVFTGLIPRKSIFLLPLTPAH